MALHEEMVQIGDRAMEAARQLAVANGRKKNAMLGGMADEIDRRRADILAANARDMAAGREQGLSAAMLDRLQLTEARIESIVKGIRVVAGLKDPIGARISRWIRPNGLEIVKRRVPIGVVGIIYESRPNVTADTAALCIKAGNAVILRGGSEAMASNAAIADAMTAGGRTYGLPDAALQLIRTTDRNAITELVQLEGRVDLVIPRGGEALIRTVTEQARVPVIKHYKGVCHVYVEETADFEMAIRIIENAKCQRPGVCNAIEKVLVHHKVARVFLPQMAERLAARGVELRGDDAACAIVPAMKRASEEDWYAEYLDLVLAVKVVADTGEAIRWINRYGSHHSDAIITESEEVGAKFTSEVDSAAVYVNASTRFTDGGEFGMGAEIGISTDKLHARGPMGLEELTTYKYVIRGNGQVRE